MRQDRLLLQDVLDAIDVIERYTPQNREEFDANPPVQSHLLRHIQIIGEAVARLSQALKLSTPQFPGDRSPPCVTLSSTRISASTGTRFGTLPPGMFHRYVR